MKELAIERTFDAPIEKVWAAFTTPDLLAKWFAPEGMSNTLAIADVQEGGVFRYCFKSDENDAVFYGRGVYQKIESMTVLSYLDSFTDAEGNDVPASHYGMDGDDIKESLVSFAFEDIDGKTKMTVRMDVDGYENIAEEMTSGWNSMFDKLETLK